ncbi:MAG: beta-galactosidase, partial [Clostridia bacterium]|nr:beta-galactosidase [Clostridia bacterium]
MRYALDLKGFRPSAVFPLGEEFSGVDPKGDKLSFNSFYLKKNGAPFYPVSGELHYSRMDERRWEDELIKMRMGGVNTVSTYLFWNHIEEEEGVFDFTGRRDLRRFVALCRKHGLYVILRVGPF